MTTCAHDGINQDEDWKTHIIKKKKKKRQSIYMWKFIMLS